MSCNNDADGSRHPAPDRTIKGLRHRSRRTDRRYHVDMTKTAVVIKVYRFTQPGKHAHIGGDRQRYRRQMNCVQAVVFFPCLAPDLPVAAAIRRPASQFCRSGFTQHHSAKAAPVAAFGRGASQTGSSRDSRTVSRQARRPAPPSDPALISCRRLPQASGRGV